MSDNEWLDMRAIVFGGDFDAEITMRADKAQWLMCEIDRLRARVAELERHHIDDVDALLVSHQNDTCSAACRYCVDDDGLCITADDIEAIVETEAAEGER